ncbi:ATP-grasp domain-containing protein [Actinophytocola sp. NPDC049390]|uniref:ATP-grasp domain-containing protein n=1 Tax=Actinophytocola sp. NPDC049390 TaxID=3363894 RepID=UPI0037A0081A
MVVVVRDVGTTWVAQTAATIRAAGCLAGLVSGPVTGDEQAELAGLVDRFVVVDDPTDPGLLAAAAREISSGHRLSALYSSSDGAVVAAALAAELLGVGRTPPAGLAAARNKYATRRAMAAAGLPTPPFALMGDAAEAADVADAVPLPAVIKPVNGAGSHLVQRVTSVEELATAYRVIADRLLDTPQLRHLYTAQLTGTGTPIDPTTTFLVEGMLRGHEYTVDLIIRDGEVELLPLVDKFFVDDRFFERGFVCPPTDLDPAMARDIGAAVTDAVLAVGLDNTVACVEVIVDEVLGPTVVEINCRPAGQIMGTLYDLRIGVNTAAEVIGLARGVPAVRTEPKLPIPIATLTLFPEGTGRLRAVHGLDDVADLPDVIRVVTSVAPGDLITEDYEIFAVNLIVAGFEDEADLMDIYAVADKLVRFEVEPR